MEDVPGIGLKQWKARDDYRLQWDDLVAILEDLQYFGQFYFYYYGTTSRERCKTAEFEPRNKRISNLPKRQILRIISGICRFCL